MLRQINFYLLALLLLATVILTTRFFNFGMMGLTTFVLAYLSKGMRRCSIKNKPHNLPTTENLDQQPIIN